MFVSKSAIFGISSFFLGAAFAPLAMAGNFGGQPGYTPDGLPPNPSAGKCYARVEVPAQYETVKVQRLVAPASESRVTIPARTKTVSRQVQIEPSRLEWRQILCETNTTPKLITSIQRALKREGFDPGPIDGVIGQDTLDALEEFQTKKNLDRGGLTYESLKALKVQS